MIEAGIRSVESYLGCFLWPFSDTCQTSTIVQMVFKQLILLDIYYQLLRINSTQYYLASNQLQFLMIHNSWLACLSIVSHLHRVQTWSGHQDHIGHVYTGQADLKQFIKYSDLTWILYWIMCVNNGVCCDHSMQ